MIPASMGVQVNPLLLHSRDYRINGADKRGGNRLFRHSKKGISDARMPPFARNTGFRGSQLTQPMIKKLRIRIRIDLPLLLNHSARVLYHFFVKHEGAGQHIARVCNRSAILFRSTKLCRNFCASAWQKLKLMGTRPGGLLKNTKSMAPTKKILDLEASRSGSPVLKLCSSFRPTSIYMPTCLSKFQARDWTFFIFLFLVVY
jgi:hypothetical protein